MYDEVGSGLLCIVIAQLKDSQEWCTCLEIDTYLYLYRGVVHDVRVLLWAFESASRAVEAMTMLATYERL